MADPAPKILFSDYHSVWVYKPGIAGMDEYGTPVTDMAAGYGYMTPADAAAHDGDGIVDITVHGPEPLTWPEMEAAAPPVVVPTGGVTNPEPPPPVDDIVQPQEEKEDPSL